MNKNEKKLIPYIEDNEKDESESMILWHEYNRLMNFLKTHFVFNMEVRSKFWKININEFWNSSVNKKKEMFEPIKEIIRKDEHLLNMLKIYNDKENKFEISEFIEYEQWLYNDSFKWFTHNIPYIFKKYNYDCVDYKQYTNELNMCMTDEELNKVNDKYKSLLNKLTSIKNTVIEKIPLLNFKDMLNNEDINYAFENLYKHYMNYWLNNFTKNTIKRR